MQQDRAVGSFNLALGQARCGDAQWRRRDDCERPGRQGTIGKFTLEGPRFERHGVSMSEIISVTTIVKYLMFTIHENRGSVTEEIQNAWCRI